MNEINTYPGQDFVETTGKSFEYRALELFLFQYEHNEMYQAFCKALKIAPGSVTSLDKIPFLPIQFFKSAKICTGRFVAQKYFESSGTTGSVASRHYVKDLSVYEKSFEKAFQLFYGDVKEYCILGLLPSYLERESSSLVYMVSSLIKQSGHESSGFYLHDFQKLQHSILQNEKRELPTILFGVTYALLDFAAAFPMALKHTIVIETGGMKGRREELTRAEVHDLLRTGFDLPEIHSEYGMTELLSQAYSKSHGIFNCPPWMKALVRADDDPFYVQSSPIKGQRYAGGVLNIIDLANVHSCAFIATDDVGKLYADGSFEVLGRLDNSDLRGCGLMIL